MANYHVGCGLFAIYAGTLNPKGDTWRNKSNVTNEAINAVAEYMYLQVPENGNVFAYGFKLPDGKYIRLKVEVSDTCPEWVKDTLERREE